MKKLWCFILGACLLFTCACSQEEMPPEDNSGVSSNLKQESQILGGVSSSSKSNEKQSSSKAESKEESSKESSQSDNAYPNQLATFSTVTTNTPSANYNMSKALNSINETVIQSGDVFSFNEAIGPADQEHGYKEGDTLIDGKLVKSYGGGICQAATTLYGAAIRAGMKVVERSSHSKPSTYCPVGLDAAIAQPNVDLKFQNVLSQPVKLICTMQGTTLTVTVMGTQPEDFDSIKISSDYLGNKKASAVRTYIKDGKKVYSEALPDSFYKHYES